MFETKKMAKMARAKFIFAALFVAGAFLHCQAQKMKMTPGSVVNFELPSFDEKSGYKEWELSGKGAKFSNESSIAVSDMRLEMFDTKPEAKSKAIFTSRTAQVSTADKTSQSLDTLFVEGEGFHLKGDDWFWSGDKRFVEMKSNVFVEFLAKADKEPEKLFISSVFAKLDYMGDANKFTFKNNVAVNGEDFKINCQELETEAPKSGVSGEIDSLKEIFARGGVEMTQQNISAKSQNAHFLPSIGKVTLDGAPELVDTKSSAAITGYKIEFSKANSSVLASSSPSAKTRAKALIISDKDGKTEVTVISANSIKMTSGEDKNLFFFDGDVTVESPEFKAFAEEFTAEALKNSKNQKYAISKIIGKKNVRFIKENRTASSEEIEILPNENKVTLNKKAKLNDKERGVNLSADEIVILQDESRAIAKSKDGEKNSYVVVDISQSANFGVGGKPTRKTQIKSRKLQSDWKAKSITLKFQDQVDIVSEDIKANCERMDVFAESERLKGKTAIKRIEAYEGARISQRDSQAQAEVIKIFPRVEVDGEYEKNSHRYIELSKSIDSPIRPKMILPEVENIGLSELPKNAVKSKTQIVSDTQNFIANSDRDNYIFEGNVEIQGTDFSGTCDKIDVTMKPDKFGNRRITLIILSGNINVKQGEKHARAGKADIHPEEQMIVLSNSPIVINEDGSKASGTRMIYKKGVKNVQIENPRIQLPSMNRKK